MAAPAGRDAAPLGDHRAVRRGRDTLTHAAAVIRRTDRYTRMRAAIVATWAVLAVATLWGACGSPGASGPLGGRPLGADVQVDRDSIMGAQVLVRNDSGRMWRDVALTLDGRWRYTEATMRPGDLVVVAVSSFRDGGQAPPPDHVPRTLSIVCDRGSARYELR